jgi:hypothetical protein
MKRADVIAPTALVSVLLALPVWTQPLAPRGQSQWNLLVAGGKGIKSIGPVCHPLESFTGSPLDFDYEQDFFQDTPADIRFTTETSTLGTVEGRKILQIIQNVQDARSRDVKVIKRLLVQRGPNDFCAIYQQIDAASQVNVEPASLIRLGGQPVLKTMDQNGQATWDEEYWVLTKNGPAHLDLSDLFKQLSEALPPSSQLSPGPLNLKQDCLRMDVWTPESDCRACGSPNGTVLARLALRNGQLHATWVHWFSPAGDGACPAAQP